MNDSKEDQDSGFGSRLPSLLKSHLNPIWARVRKFCIKNKHLSQVDTWREISQELPRRAKVSLVLVIVLMGTVAWLQTKIVPPIAQTPTATQVAPTPRQAARKPTSTPIALLVSNTASLKAASQATATQMPTATPKVKPTPFFTIHTVKANETLISIAAKYNITTEELLAANDIRDPSNLEKGRELLIPPDDKLYQGEIILHELKKGDTLLAIASKHGSSVKAIEVANPHLELDKLVLGQTIAIPVIFSEINPVTAPKEPQDATYHTVEPGEIPLMIAAKYDIPLEILLTANNIVDPTLLQIGQELIIPPHDGISLGFPVILYELTETDTLVGIASRFGSSVKDILAVNPDLDPGSLEAGQLVAIPVIFAPPRPTPVPISPSAPRPTPGPPPGLADLQQQLIATINSQREAHGLAAYTPDEQLAEIALGHAQDMYVRDFFAHVSPDGQSLRDRLVGAGFSASMTAGENIQRNTQPRNKTVEVAVNWFMNSAPHRHNILHDRHNHIGVGVVEGPPGWFTFVLVFAER